MSDSAPGGNGDGHTDPARTEIDEPDVPGPMREVAVYGRGVRTALRNNATAYGFSISVTVAYGVASGQHGQDSAWGTVTFALGAGVVKTSLGREVLPDDKSYVTGPIELHGSTASHSLMMGADTLFMIGTSFPYTEWLPEEDQCKGVEIDLDGRMMGCGIRWTRTRSVTPRTR